MEGIAKNSYKREPSKEFNLIWSSGFCKKLIFKWILIKLYLICIFAKKNHRQSDKILLEKQEYMLNNWLILAHSNKKCSRDEYFKNISILSNYMFGKALLDTILKDEGLYLHTSSTHQTHTSICIHLWEGLQCAAHEQYS